MEAVEVLFMSWSMMSFGGASIHAWIAACAAMTGV
jgi:hypothetical protein